MRGPNSAHRIGPTVSARARIDRVDNAPPRRRARENAPDAELLRNPRDLFRRRDFNAELAHLDDWAHALAFLAALLRLALRRARRDRRTRRWEEGGGAANERM